ncbi:NTE family protein [Porphyrobacter sp. MBR-155]|jgi:NTE family protein|uniref:patatin-like phospholipase family protein n=1 Tax=Porphyrobacter sp. MBR-155 TaxID=3156464 RepID=UPI00339B5FE3
MGSGNIYDKKVSLVLQGGGALGSYQAGVYEAIATSRYCPDWVAGISIGAINAALIAGNPPEHRVARLREFWETITAPSSMWPTDLKDPWSAWQKKLGGQAALMFGQPGFFTPNNLFDWLGATQPVSYYKTEELKTTLERLVDFDRINHAEGVRLSVGAVNIRTARFAYFDSAEIPLRAEHIMASGALPPGFPPVEIDGEFYWDGGLVSNTPLQYVLDYMPRRSRLTFQVDVFQAAGQTPTSLEEVAERQNDIRYASRTRDNTNNFKQRHEVRYAINELINTLPENLRETPEAKRLRSLGCVTTMDIAQIIYRPFSPQGAAKDYEFTRPTMLRRWKQGLRDATATLEAAPWLKPAEPHEGVRVFDVMHERLVAQNAGKSGNDRDVSDVQPVMETKPA